MIDYSLYNLYSIGRVVKMKDNFTYRDKPVPAGYLGHVVGFDYIECDHVVMLVIVVKWFTGHTTSINPSNLEFV